MPTPFMHIAAAHRFLTDEAVNAKQREFLSDPAQLGAFLLGNVAPDARVSGSLDRSATHFFEYAAQIQPHAVNAMLSQHPELSYHNTADAQRAFIAGYIAHLAMDVTWSEAMLYPHFYKRPDWADPQVRYIMLHVLLCHLDERDYRQWPSDYASALASSAPHHWTAFLPDADLTLWRDLIALQICADCASQTLEILGGRVTIGQAGLADILNDTERMQAELWDYVPLEVVSEVEAAMYSAMVAQVDAYFNAD